MTNHNPIEPLEMHATDEGILFIMTAPWGEVPDANADDRIVIVAPLPSCN